MNKYIIPSMVITIVILSAITMLRCNCAEASTRINYTEEAKKPYHKQSEAYQDAKACQDLMREVYHPSIRCPMQYVKATVNKVAGTISCDCIKH